MAELDMGSAYRVAGHGAVAWRLEGYATEWTEERWEYCGEGDPDDEANYLYSEPEEVEDRTRVRAHMVGDDVTFVHDVEDLTPLEDSEYCSGCGQIGCGWC